MEYGNNSKKPNSRKEEEQSNIQLKLANENLDKIKKSTKETTRALNDIFKTISGSDDVSKTFDDLANGIQVAASAIDALSSKVQGQDTMLNDIASVQAQFDGLQNTFTNINSKLDDLVKSADATSLNDVDKVIRNIENMEKSTADVSKSLKKSLQKMAEESGNVSEVNDEIKTVENNFQNISDKIKSRFNELIEMQIQGVISGISASADKSLAEISNGRGLQKKFNQSITNTGNEAASVYQNAVVVDRMNDRQHFWNKSKADFSGIANTASEMGVMQTKYEHVSNRVSESYSKAEEEQDPEKRKQLIKDANEQYKNLVAIQKAMNAKAKELGKQMNLVSPDDLKRLGQEGQELSKHVKNILKETSANSGRVISIGAAFHIKDNETNAKGFAKDKAELDSLNKTLEASNKKTSDLFHTVKDDLSSAFNTLMKPLRAIGKYMPLLGAGGMFGLMNNITKPLEYYSEKHKDMYTSMGSDAYAGVHNLGQSQAAADSRLMRGNALYMASGGMIDRRALNNSYNSAIREVGGAYGSSPEQGAADMNELVGKTALMQNVWGIDQGTMNNAYQTFYKDMRMNASDAAEAIARCAQTAQASGIPVGKYLNLISGLSQDFMKIGIAGDKAETIMSNLLGKGMRADVAKDVASQTANSMNSFSQNYNMVGYAAAMQGMDPFHGLALASYSHEANGEVRKGWAGDMSKMMDTMLSQYSMAYGDNPDVKRFGVTDTLKKQFGFSQRTASTLASSYLQGDTKQFEEMFEKEMDKKENPNGALEEVNKKLGEQLGAMTGQLAGSDRQKAEMDGKLYGEADTMGKYIDDIIVSLAPLLLETQQFLLDAAQGIMDLLDKFLNSKLWDKILNPALNTMLDHPLATILTGVGTLVVGKNIKRFGNLAKNGGVRNAIKGTAKGALWKTAKYAGAAGVAYAGWNMLTGGAGSGLFNTISDFFSKGNVFNKIYDVLDRIYLFITGKKIDNGEEEKKDEKPKSSTSTILDKLMKAQGITGNNWQSGNNQSNPSNAPKKTTTGDGDSDSGSGNDSGSSSHSSPDIPSGNKSNGGDTQAPSSSSIIDSLMNNPVSTPGMVGATAFVIGAGLLKQRKGFNHGGFSNLSLSGNSINNPLGSSSSSSSDSSDSGSSFGNSSSSSSSSGSGSKTATNEKLKNVANGSKDTKKASQDASKKSAKAAQAKRKEAKTVSSGDKKQKVNYKRAAKEDVNNTKKHNKQVRKNATEMAKIKARQNKAKRASRNKFNRQLKTSGKALSKMIGGNILKAKGKIGKIFSMFHSKYKLLMKAFKPIGDVIGGIVKKVGAPVSAAIDLGSDAIDHLMKGDAVEGDGVNSAVNNAVPALASLVGGAAGSVFGPVGTVAGAALGTWAGNKLNDTDTVKSLRQSVLSKFGDDDESQDQKRREQKPWAYDKNGNYKLSDDYEGEDGNSEGPETSDKDDLGSMNLDLPADEQDKDDVGEVDKEYKQADKELDKMAGNDTESGSNSGSGESNSEGDTSSDLGKSDNSSIEKQAEQAQNDLNKASGVSDSEMQAMASGNDSGEEDKQRKADDSRMKASKDNSDKVVGQAKKEEKLSTTRNKQLQMFQNLHKQLMQMFQSSVKEEHGNLWKKLDIMEHILFDINKNIITTGKIMNTGLANRGGGPGGGDAAANKKLFYQKLKAAGYSDAQAAGILANIEQESGFNAESGKGSTNQGLVQWDATRWARLVAYAHSVNQSEWNPGIQMDFAIQEAQGRGLTPDKIGDDARAACANWNETEENSGEDPEKYRYGKIPGIEADIAAGKFNGTPPPASDPVAAAKAAAAAVGTTATDTTTKPPQTDNQNTDSTTPPASNGSQVMSVNWNGDGKDINYYNASQQMQNSSANDIAGLDTSKYNVSDDSSQNNNQSSGGQSGNGTNNTKPKDGISANGTITKNGKVVDRFTPETRKKIEANLAKGVGPNGTPYRQNDIDYLKAHGYTDMEEIKIALNLDKRYAMAPDNPEYLNLLKSGGVSSEDLYKLLHSNISMQSPFANSAKFVAGAHGVDAYWEDDSTYLPNKSMLKKQLEESSTLSVMNKPHYSGANALMAGLYSGNFVYKSPKAASSKPSADSTANTPDATTATSEQQPQNSAVDAAKQPVKAAEQAAQQDNTNKQDKPKSTDTSDKQQESQASDDTSQQPDGSDEADKIAEQTAKAVTEAAAIKVNTGAKMDNGSGKPLSSAKATDETINSGIGAAMVKAVTEGSEDQDKTDVQKGTENAKKDKIIDVNINIEAAEENFMKMFGNSLKNAIERTGIKVSSLEQHTTDIAKQVTVAEMTIMDLMGAQRAKQK